MDLLLPESGLLFWMTLVFIIVFLILRKWGFPSIIKMVEERNAFIDEGVRKAHEASQQLAQMQEEGKAIVKEARRQRESILNEATSERDNIIRKAQEEGKKEYARIVEEARMQIEREKENSEKEVRNKSIALGFSLAEKLIRGHLDKNEKQSELIDRILDEEQS